MTVDISEVLQGVRRMAREILEYAGMELVHLEMKREPGGQLVRLYIDKDGGVTLDDCTLISRQLSAQLDIEDPIEGRYTLEVSSPGLDRPLFTDRDFARFAGRQIRLSTRVPLDGRRNFQGRLEGIADGSVRMTLQEGRVVAIPRDQVARARLEVEI
ncbi:MAG TPA: ribosome maturation factor RimP [Geobacteraceae bacterium]|nr:ribosome maturation factor RimP [Geobacteraceae bacterium]